MIDALASVIGAVVVVRTALESGRRNVIVFAAVAVVLSIGWAIVFSGRSSAWYVILRPVVDVAAILAAGLSLAPGRRRGSLDLRP
jgi:uncharacterized membrane protein